MIIDALQRLTLAGFPISEYEYTGFGSIYFVDFVLFHKMLGIHRMLTVEHSDELKDRIVFNRPFNCIQVRMEAASSVIPTLSPDSKHLLWLDYDGPISSENLGDTLSAMTHLSVGSIFLITLDVEPPELGDEDTEATAGPRQWKAYYKEQAGDLLDPNLPVSKFAKSNLPAITTKIVFAALRQGLAGRHQVHFSPLFNFRYKDGHEMLTLGGMIATSAEESLIQRSTVHQTSTEVPYVRRTLAATPYRIPNLKVTRKERIYLDSMMPRATKKKGGFHLPDDLVEQYSQVYRFFPAYAELLL